MASTHFIVVLALAFLAVTSAANVRKLPGVGGALINGTPGFDYNCAGKADGNYPHPTKCTHYVACVAQSHAYEMICALNHDGKPLHYVAWSGPNPVTSRCDYPEVAGCGGGCKLV